MKLIQIDSGKYGVHYAKVDDSDYEYLMQWKWFLENGTHTNYAIRVTIKNGTPTTMKMHRVILGLGKGDKREGDHINHEGLDNQRHNLRIATSAQNKRNKRSYCGKSKYKGLSWRQVKGKRLDKETGEYVPTLHEPRWMVHINVDGKQIYLGQFPCTTEGEIIAARTYDEWAKKYFGAFAYLNFGDSNTYQIAV